MSFPLGRPILVLLILAAICAVLIGLRQTPPADDLVVWVFAESHADSFRKSPDGVTPSLVQTYESRYRKRVRVKLVNEQAALLRINNLLDRAGSLDASAEIPDLLAVEITWVGVYFRPTVEQIAFLPLNDRIRSAGLEDRILKSRVAAWSKQGRIFGIPHDVHPVSLTYRVDLWKEAGIDIESARTWEEFHELGLAFRKYWRERGRSQRFAIELSATGATDLTIMLQQRGINVLDADGRIQLTDPRVAQTIAFYAQLVAGPRRIAGQPTPGGNLWARDFAEGDLCATITPDWKAGFLKYSAPQVAGKARMMPLPRFDPDDAPTASWGGTMMAIPRVARDPDESWRLLMHFYFSEEALRMREKFTAIIPPDQQAWDDPVWHQPDPFFASQAIGSLYVDLARQMKPRYVTPYTGLGIQALARVLNKAVAEVEAGRIDGLEDACRGWLVDVSRELERRIEFGRFDE